VNKGNINGEKKEKTIRTKKPWYPGHYQLAMLPTLEIKENN
jgi:hypothetical protein